MPDPGARDRRVERRHLLGEVREHRPVGLDRRRLAGQLVRARIAGQRARFPTSEKQCVDVGPPVQGGVRHPKGRQVGPQPGDRYGDDVFVAHRHDRQIETGKARHVPGMSACGMITLAQRTRPWSVSTAATAPPRSPMPVTRTSVAKRTPAARACSRYAIARS